MAYAYTNAGTEMVSRTGIPQIWVVSALTSFSDHSKAGGTMEELLSAEPFHTTCNNTYIATFHGNRRVFHNATVC